MVPDGTTRIEMLCRSERLREYIGARTGLDPQTIEPTSLRNASPDQMLVSPSFYEVVVTILAVLFSCVSIGANIVFEHLSGSEPLNWLVGASLPLACVAAALPFCLAWLYSKPRRSHAQPQAAVVVGELPEPPGWSYAVRQGARMESRLALGLTGITLSVNALPAFALWFPAPIAGVFGVESVATSDGHAIFSYVLFIIGVGALLLLYVCRALARALTEPTSRG
jgi:hypothetical protein